MEVTDTTNIHTEVTAVVTDTTNLHTEVTADMMSTITNTSLRMITITSPSMTMDTGTRKNRTVTSLNMTNTSPSLTVISPCTKSMVTKGLLMEDTIITVKLKLITLKHAFSSQNFKFLCIFTGYRPYGYRPKYEKRHGYKPKYDDYKPKYENKPMDDHVSIIVIYFIIV